MPQPSSTNFYPRPLALRRRHLLAGAAAANLLAGVSPVAHAEIPGPETALTRADWIALERTLQGGRILLPGAQNYLALSTGENAAFENKRPLGIIWCTNEADVRAAINWCRTRGIAPKIRGGGHNYAGYSMTDGVMIATGGITKGINLNNDGTIWLPGGLNNGSIYPLLARHGLALTHGRCATVGLAGFLLGGGIGFSMRNFGVGSDMMLETDVVLADGSRLTATPDNAASDLFWACTGGAGGNFGVNTGFKMKTMKAPDVTVFHAQWGFAGGRQLEVAQTLMRELTEADQKFGCRISLKSCPKTLGNADVAIDLLGQYMGPADDVETLLAPARAMARPILYLVKEQSYWQGQSFLNQSNTPYCFQERSLFIKGALSDALMAQCCSRLAGFPAEDAQTHADVRLFLTGGKMNRPERDSAFVHRNSNWLVDVAISWSETAEVEAVQACLDWQNRLFDFLSPHGTGAYQNFPDPALKNPQLAYYGAALGRLSAVKKRYDPGNMFNYPQSIPV
jgi:hypothetical protein